MLAPPTLNAECGVRTVYFNVKSCLTARLSADITGIAIPAAVATRPLRLISSLNCCHGQSLAWTVLLAQYHLESYWHPMKKLDLLYWTAITVLLPTVATLSEETSIWSEQWKDAFSRGTTVIQEPGSDLHNVRNMFCMGNEMAHSTVNVRVHTVCKETE